MRNVLCSVRVKLVERINARLRAAAIVRYSEEEATHRLIHRVVRLYMHVQMLGRPCAAAVRRTRGTGRERDTSVSLSASSTARRSRAVHEAVPLRNLLMTV